VAEETPFLSVWDVASGKRLRRVPVRKQPGRLLAYSPDGKLLAAVTATGVTQVWEAASGKRLAVCRGPECSPFGLAFVNGKVLTAGKSWQGICVWEAPSGKILSPTEGHLGPVSAVGFLRDGRVVSAGANTFCFWDASSGKELRRFTVAVDDGGRENPTFALTPAGTHLACLDDPEGTVRLFDLPSGEEAWETARQVGSQWAVCFSVDGTSLAISTDGWIDKKEARVHRVLEVSTGRERGRFEGEAGERPAAALSPGGKILATAVNRIIRGGRSRTVSVLQLWDVSRGKEVGRVSRDDGWLQTLAFSPDGAWLMIAQTDGTLFLLDSATGQEIASWKAESGLVTRLLFAPDGRTLAAIKPDYQTGGTKIALWEVCTRSVQREWTAPHNLVTSVAFSPDGRLLASGCTDSTVLLWDVLGRLPNGEALPGKPSQADLDKLWSELADGNAARGRVALLKLAAAPKEAVELVRQKLPPAGQKAVTAAEIDRWIARLDDDFAVREESARWLVEAGRAAKPALVKALEAAPSAEKRRRLERLQEKLAQVLPGPEMVRPIRAAELLERIGTPEARQVLEALSKGDTDAWLTREARAAFQRLGRQADTH
jgi:WD40 repeat protein